MSKYLFIFSYKFLMNFRLFFGNYYDLGRTPTVNLLAKLYCIAFAVLNIIQVLFALDLQNLWINTAVYQIVLLIHFAITIALPLFIKTDDFSESSLLLEDIDNELGLSCSDLKSPVPMSVLSIGFLVQCLCLVFYRSVSQFSIFSLIILTGIIRYLTITSSMCPLIMKLDWCQNTLKVLRKILKNDLKTNNEQEKIRCVTTFINVYKNLSKYLSVTEQCFSPLISLNIVSNILKLLIFIFYIIDPRFISDSISIGLWICLLFLEVSVQFVPAVLMELSADKLDAITATLADELLECEDTELCTVLYDALDYTEVRPMTFNLWLNIPMNLSLILRFIGLCCTYIISLLQFKY